MIVLFLGQSGEKSLPISKYTKHVFGGMIGLYFLCGLFRYFDIIFPGIPFRFSALSFVGFCGIIISFIFYTQKDLPQQYSRNYYLVMLGMLLLWQILDLLLILMPTINDTVTHLLWYLIYVPMLYIPACFLLGVAHYEVPQFQRLPWPWALVHLVSCGFIGLVLTNDFHRLVFDFTDSRNAAYVHSYELGYFLLMGWSFSMYIAAILLIRRRANLDGVKGSRMYLILILLLLFVYNVWYVSGMPIFPRFIEIFTLQDFMLLATILPLEIAIRRGHVRSNYNYNEVIEASTISLTIEDNAGNLFFHTNKSFPITDYDRQRARAGSHYIDSNHLLHSQRIDGGRAFWVEDMSPINALTASLRELQEDLEQQNDIIQAENDMIARSAKADEQNRLYSMLMRMADPQLQKLSDILSHMNADDEDFREKLAKACIYKVYVKRFSNLCLLSQESSEMDLFELRSALMESSEYLQLNNINTAIQVNGSGTFPSGLLVQLYSFFQQMVEGLLPGLLVVSTNVSGKGDNITADYIFTVDEDMDEESINAVTARFHGRYVGSDNYTSKLDATKTGATVILHVDAKRIEEEDDDDIS